MKVRELLTDASKWIQHSYAVDSQGNNVGCAEPTATQWCLVGAFGKCYGFQADGAAVFDKLYVQCGGAISVWNDAPGRTFTEVKQLVELLDI